MSEVLILSVRLESGNFEASLKEPLTDDAKRNAFIVEKWLSLIGHALAIGVGAMNATIDEPKDKP